MLLNCLICFTLSWFHGLVFCMFSVVDQWHRTLHHLFLCVRFCKDKLNGTNYSDWVHNLRIVLRSDKNEIVLDTPIPDEPVDNASTALKNAYKRACDDSLEVSCLMLACMEPELQKKFEDQEAYDMIVALKDMF